MIDEPAHRSRARPRACFAIRVSNWRVNCARRIGISKDFTKNKTWAARSLACVFASTLCVDSSLFVFIAIPEVPGALRETSQLSHEAATRVPL